VAPSLAIDGRCLILWASSASLLISVVRLPTDSLAGNFGRRIANDLELRRLESFQLSSARTSLDSRPDRSEPGPHGIRVVKGFDRVIGEHSAFYLPIGITDFEGMCSARQLFAW
jgi:hypothetical protein